MPINRSENDSEQESITALVAPNKLKRAQELLASLAGIDVSQYKDDFLARQILKRSTHNGISVDDYIQTLESDEHEIAQLIGSLTVHHTSFFRDFNKYQALQNVVVPDLLELRKKVRKIKVWSAGCASGEEPYSIAMVLNERLADSMGDWDVRILASDMNEKLLDMAREGCYQMDHLSRTKIDAGLLRRYFENSREDTDNVRISDSVKKKVSFVKHNLIKDAYPDRVDVIFCRNVLIYIKPEFTRQIIMRFHDVLNEGGYLVLGNFESLDSTYLPHFERVKIYKEFLYRKISSGSELHKAMIEKQKHIQAGLGL